ncbi:DMBXc-paired class homeobox protein, partial [Ramicandelaber brevisporus]
RRRNTMNPYQTRVLTRVFQYTQLPNTGLRERLGVALGMPARTVQVWFQNQRQKHK